MLNNNIIYLYGSWCRICWSSEIVLLLRWHKIGEINFYKYYLSVLLFAFDTRSTATGEVNRLRDVWKFHFLYWSSLSDIINFYSLYWKKYDCLVISGGIEITQFL